MLTWDLKMGRLTMRSASSRKGGSMILSISERWSLMGISTRSFSLLMSMMRSTPASSAALLMPLTSRHSMVSHPIAEASARMISLGLPLRRALMAAATTSGLVFTALSGG